MCVAEDSRRNTLQCYSHVQKALRNRNQPYPLKSMGPEEDVQNSHCVGNTKRNKHRCTRVSSMLQRRAESNMYSSAPCPLKPMGPRRTSIFPSAWVDAKTNKKTTGRNRTGQTRSLVKAMLSWSRMVKMMSFFSSPSFSSFSSFSSSAPDWKTPRA